ncbi:MAG: histidine phosphotransferase family protein [Cucumibacter sp.]
MAEVVELKASDLAAMLCSRVCHDLISPVGAIGNGLEVLADPDQKGMAEFAQELIENSARQARAKLEFARLAFGASSTAGTEIDTRDAEKVSHSYVGTEKAAIDWKIPPTLLPKNKVKMLLNMVLISVGCVPRGGVVTVVSEGAPGAERFTITATGPKTLVPNGMPELLAGTPQDGRVDAQVVQPFYTGLLARETGMDLSLALTGGIVTFTAFPKVTVAQSIHT